MIQLLAHEISVPLVAKHVGCLYLVISYLMNISFPTLVLPTPLPPSLVNFIICRDLRLYFSSHCPFFGALFPSCSGPYAFGALSPQLCCTSQCSPLLGDFTFRSTQISIGSANLSSYHSQPSSTLTMVLSVLDGMPSHTHYPLPSCYVVIVSIPSKSLSLVDALCHSHWHHAIAQEFSPLLHNQAWCLVLSHPHMHVLDYKWVYRLKTHPNGNIDYYKAHLVTSGVG